MKEQTLIKFMEYFLVLPSRIGKLKWKKIPFLFVAILIILLLLIGVIPRVSLAAVAEAASARNQIQLPEVSGWPDMPAPYDMKDWKQTGISYTNFVFDEKLTGTNLPLVKVTSGQGPYPDGYQGDVFDMSSYATKPGGLVGEAVTQLSAVASGSLLGIDMTKLYGHDWVSMCRVYSSKTLKGDSFISNNMGTDCQDYWYTLYPTFLYNAVSSANPSSKELAADVLATADTWLKALKYINHDWISTGFSLADMEPFNIGFTVPEGVAGVAYLEYQAYLISKDAKYLEAAYICLQDAAAMDTNPYYEILGSLLPIVAARANAEQGMAYPIDKFLNWALDADSPYRTDWGAINSRWGDYDAYGLQGSRSDTAGYAFAMNTFVTGAQLAPVARYAPEYSDAIGKLLLALANNARLFFPAALPENMQSNYALAEGMGATEFIAYEGLRNSAQTTPFATGDDGNAYLGLYGSGTIGMFASMIEKTNVEGILQIDLLKTDFRAPASYPTYLYYNPYPKEKTVRIELGTDFYDLYEVTSKTTLLSNVTGGKDIVIPGRQSVQIVLLPANAVIAYRGKTAFADGIAYDYDYLNGVNIKTTGVLLDKAQLRLVTGADASLKPAILPYGASDTGVVWTSSDDKVAAVDSDGIVHAKAPGSAVISAIPEGGGQKADCEVTVLQGIDILGGLTGDCLEEAGNTSIINESGQGTGTAVFTKRLNIGEYPYLYLKVGNFTKQTSWGLSITNSAGRKYNIYSNYRIDPGKMYSETVDLEKITGLSSEDDYTVTFTIFGPKSMGKLSYDILYAQFAPYQLNGSEAGAVLDDLTDVSNWQTDTGQGEKEIDITGFPDTASWNQALGANADLEIADGMGRITNQVDGWSSITFEKLYDIDRYPIFRCQFANPSGESVKYSIKLGKADTGSYYHEFTLQGDIPVGEKPEIEINLKELTNYSGMSDIGFSFCIIGQPGDSYELEYAKALPDENLAQGDPLVLTPGNDGYAAVSFGPGSGVMTKQYTVDLSGCPALLGMIDASTGVNWSIIVKGVSGMADTDTQYVIASSDDKDKLKTGEKGSEFAANIANETGWSGECTFELMVLMYAPQKETIHMYRFMKAASATDHYSSSDGTAFTVTDEETIPVATGETDLAAASEKPASAAAHEEPASANIIIWVIIGTVFIVSILAIVIIKWKKSNKRTD